MAQPLLASFVEQFHLVFLAHLGRQIDKRAHVVKGGCNLRFFHGSIRYSEDMDLDVERVTPHELKDKVRAVLAARAFSQALAARSIDVEHVTEHKQTPTVQWWKFGLTVAGVARPLPTKIEFSHRGLDAGVEVNSIDRNVIGGYGLASFMASHYDRAAAVRQKVRALAGRTETQARDVFDLHHLLARGPLAAVLPGIDRRSLALARERALTVDFAMFKGHVLAFLPPDEQATWDSASVWETVVLEVVNALEEADR